MKKIIFTILFILLVSCPILVNAKASNKPNENFANLVFFAYYDGTTAEVEEDVKYYKDNSISLIDLYEGSSKRCFTNYLKEISYGKFNVKNIFPQLENGIIKPIKLNIHIKDSYERNNDSLLIEQIVATYPSISNQIVDYNGDGYIDNLTIIIKARDGYTAATHSTFVSHKADYPENKKYLNKYIGTYNIVSTESLTELSSGDVNSAGVITHEFLHSLGYPDLYRSETTDDYPVHVWDIMASANPGMSYPLAYLRKAITNWIDIETVTESKSLRLDIQSNKDGNQAYILKSPLNDYEYFVVEYRKKDFGVSELDRLIGGSGVIVYRVDTTVEGYSNHYGKTGIYVFRPQTGFNTEQSKVYNAFLSAESRRTSIGTSNMNLGLADGALTFSDGSNSGIVIKNVSSTDGAYMTLDVEIPKAENFDLWKNKNLPDLLGDNANINKKIAITKYKNKLYALTYGNNRIYTQSLENNHWVTKGTYSNIKTEVLTNIKVVELNNDLYLIANNTNAINVYKWNNTNNKWNLFCSYPETLNDLDASVINNKLYIAGSTSDKANLYLLNNNKITKVGNYYNGKNGSPKIGKINNSVYVSTRSIDGNLLLYQYQANKFHLINTNINTNNYDLESLDNKLYFILGTDLDHKKISLKKYDGNRWETISSSLALSFPNIVVSQGNLYILGTHNNNLYTYSYQENTKKFAMEGTIVDTGSDLYDTSLVALDNSIYVGMKKMNNTLLVKAKKTVNSLVSLRITPPNKVTYKIGETFDKTGLKVIANYTNGQKEITNYSITNFNTNKVGTYRATITYEGFSNTFAYTVTNTVTDKNNRPISLRITPPNKVTYKIGETFNKTGLKVIANYPNRQKEITNYTITNFNTNKVGTYRATITYEGISNTFTYTVINNPSNTVTNKNPSPKIKNGNYVIRSALNNNKVLDVKGGSNTSGTNVQLYDYNASNAQIWNITYLKDGYYKISSKINNKLVLDVSGGKKNNGTNVQVYYNNNSKSQQWIIKEAGGGYYYLISTCNALNLDVAAAQTKNGTNIQMYKGNTSKAQKFKLDRQDKTIANGNYVIRSALNNNKVLDVTGASKKSGTNVQLYQYNGSNAQIWNITYLKDGYYKISSKLNNQLVLDVFGANKNNGANVQVHYNNNSNAQKWFIKEAGGGYYYLISRCNVLNLDVAAAQTKNGTNIQMYKGNSSKAQKFKLDKKF